MRILLACVALIVCSTFLQAESISTTRPGFANFKVSARTISLNQVLRVEFTTLPRQVVGVDIDRTVSDALDASRLSGHWRPLSTPTVTEHEKTHTITVTFALLPRKVGELNLPKVPLTWIGDNQVAEFGIVTVSPQLVIGGNQVDLPSEITGIAGHLWGERLADVQAQFGTKNMETTERSTTLHLQPGLDLIYREGALGEARLITADLPLDRARDSFLARWGAPQIQEGDSITWILGWTRITATATESKAGTVLVFVREDIQSILDRARVGRDVFGILDGSGSGAAAPVQSPEAQQRDRQAEAERELNRLTNGE